MIIFGILLITFGVIVSAQWLWILGIVIAGIAAIGTLRGVHTRIIPDRAHYF